MSEDGAQNGFEEQIDAPQTRSCNLLNLNLVSPAGFEPAFSA